MKVRIVLRSVAIKKLESFSADDFKRLAPGYTSSRKYTVKKVERADRIAITLGPVALAKPYVKNFSFLEDDMKRYEKVVEQVLSLGAYEGNHLVGIAIAERRDWNRSLWLWELTVEETFRKSGIGTQLVNALGRLAKDAGLRVMVCETQNTNMPAIEFYRKAGFELDGIDLSYYTNPDMTTGEVALFMKRKLE